LQVRQQLGFINGVHFLICSISSRVFFISPLLRARCAFAVRKRYSPIVRLHRSLRAFVKVNFSPRLTRVRWADCGPGIESPSNFTPPPVPNRYRGNQVDGIIAQLSSLASPAEAL
jgi:hypothetical protein